MAAFKKELTKQLKYRNCKVMEEDAEVENCSLKEPNVAE